MRNEYRVKFQFAEFSRTSTETFSLVFLPGSKFLSTSEEFTPDFVSLN